MPYFAIDDQHKAEVEGQGRYRFLRSAWLADEIRVTKRRDQMRIPPTTGDIIGIVDMVTGECFEPVGIEAGRIALIRKEQSKWPRWHGTVYARHIERARRAQRPRYMEAIHHA